MRIFIKDSLLSRVKGTMIMKIINRATHNKRNEMKLSSVVRYRNGYSRFVEF